MNIQSRQALARREATHGLTKDTIRLMVTYSPAQGGWMITLGDLHGNTLDRRGPYDTLSQVHDRASEIRAHYQIDEEHST